MACVFCCVLCIALACTITAYAAYSPSPRLDVPLERRYTEEVTLNVPALNGSVSTLADNVYMHKASDDNKCSFATINNQTAAGADARLINELGQKRSAWARDLLTNTVRKANTSGALSGYKYYAQISSDLVQLTSFDITFKFSPDNMS